MERDEEHQPLLKASTLREDAHADDGSGSREEEEAIGGDGGEDEAEAELGVDIAIEGMVIALVSELEARGYSVPSGLVLVRDEVSESEAEVAAYKSVLEIARHRAVLARNLPKVSRPADDGFALYAPLSNGASPARTRAASRATLTGTAAAPGAPDEGASSPSASAIFDPRVTPSPSALFLAALLSLSISLQAEPSGAALETDPGVDGELRAFKARRELGERIYAVILSLLDSYLISGDPCKLDGGDALVTLLFQDFPLRFDSNERATCSLDLLLTLASQPLAEVQKLIGHPVVLASSEYVFRNGLIRHRSRSLLSWSDCIRKIDRFSIPRILHTQTYILSSLHALVTIYILLFSSYVHFDAFNPLAPDIEVGVPEKRHSAKGFSLVSALVWYLWVFSTLGWAGEVGRAWNHRGPHPSLPLSPSTLLPLIQHSLVFFSLLLRFILLFTPGAPKFILETSVSLLAWSIPFMAVSRVLPQNLPLFGTPTHHRFGKIRDGRKRRDVGYRPPPKRVPESHRSLRSLEAQLGGLIQFGTYFVVVGFLLLISLGGELDYPSLVLLYPAHVIETATMSGGVSPIEARTSLAFTLLVGIVLAYFAGGRPSASGKIVGPGERGLTDLDGWDRHGPEVAFRARRERLAVTRYFCYIPPSAVFPPEPVPSAYSTPPLSPPLNLIVPLIILASFVLKRFDRQERAQYIQERGRLWLWRVGVAPLAVWSLLAKVLRHLRSEE